MAGHKDITLLLLARGAVVINPGRPARGLPPPNIMHMVVFTGNFVLLQALLDAGYHDMIHHGREGHKEAPILWAYLDGQFKFVKVFHKFGAPLEDPERGSFLRHAVWKHRFGAAKRLLAIGADPSPTPYSPPPPRHRHSPTHRSLLEAICRDHHCLRYCLTVDKEPRKHTHSSFIREIWVTPEHQQSQRHELRELITALVRDYGMDMEGRDCEGWDRTPLMWACASRNPFVARVLIELGADVHATNARGERPWILAAVSDWGTAQGRARLEGLWRETLWGRRALCC
ncbi:ankyrin repeat-containing domain protein [Lasiosphaeria hispida]|uniref:Ankyrin repeat-containing domain protein n=1 Tax=Lasiosphaeria hispida TaxID=260671 RepID=A0AAJ0HDI6_9PEZI|nr:ankyrin repeat-containing domain protein [Lasiosphaeria hispida]